MHLEGNITKFKNQLSVGKKISNSRSFIKKISEKIGGKKFIQKTKIANDLKRTSLVGNLLKAHYCRRTIFKSNCTLFSKNFYK